MARRDDTKKSPHPKSVRRKLLTLWNCYSFYVTYASLDEITADKLNIPLAQRSELGPSRGSRLR